MQTLHSRWNRRRVCLGRKRTASASLMQLRGHHRRRRQSNPHSTMSRRWWKLWHTFLLRSELHRWHVWPSRIHCCEYGWCRSRCHCHIAQSERVRWHVHSTKLLCQHRDVTDQITLGAKNSVSQIRETEFQRHSVLPAVSSGQFPRHLQNHSQIQHARKPTLWRTHAAKRSWWHVRQKERRIRTLVPREGRWKLPFCHATRNVSLLRIRCQTPQSRMSKVSRRVQATRGLDAIKKCVTIASACNRFWRKKLPTTSRTVRFTFQSVYQSPQVARLVRTSTTKLFKKSHPHCKKQRWSACCQPSRRRIRPLWSNHSLSHRVRVPRLSVAQASTLFSKKDIPIAHAERTMQEVYESTLRKHELLKQRGYDVKVQWECDWDTEVKTNQDLQQFLDTFEIIEPMQPRDAFFRGRTNAVKLHHTLRRHQFFVSVGQPKLRIPHRTSRHPRQSRRSRHPSRYPSLLRNGQSRCSCTGTVANSPFHSARAVSTKKYPKNYWTNHIAVPTLPNNGNYAVPGVHQNSSQPSKWDTASSNLTKSGISHRNNASKVSSLTTWILGSKLSKNLQVPQLGHHTRNQSTLHHTIQTERKHRPRSSSQC